MQKLLKAIYGYSTLKAFRMKTLTIDYRPGTYVKDFDGWRGVGILFVVLAHYIPSLFIGSWVFMEMFFVMSGFLITGILLDSKTKKNYFKVFYLRRVMRVFPLYYLSLILLFFIIPVSWLDTSYHRTHQLWFWLYIENWLFALKGWPKIKALSHFWSLAIEEQFYIVWPFVVLLFSKKSLIRFCLFLFLFSILFRNLGLKMGFVIPFPYVATLARMEGIVLGAILAVLVRSNKEFLEKYGYMVTFVSGFFSILIFTISKTMHMEYYLNYSVNYTLVDIFFGGMILMTLCSNELAYLRKIFRIPLIKQLGVMSYCIYIFHHPIQIMINNLLLYQISSFANNENVGKAVCLLIAFVVTIPVVYFIHKKIEVPLWKVKKHI